MGFPNTEKSMLSIDIKDWRVIIKGVGNDKVFSKQDLRMVELRHAAQAQPSNLISITGVKIYLSGVAEPIAYNVSTYSESSIHTVYCVLLDLLNKKETKE